MSTTCRECGEELWTSTEAHGLCVACQHEEASNADPLDYPEAWAAYCLDAEEAAR